MISNLKTKQKLLLFPIFFVVVVVVSSIIYLHFNNVKEEKNEIAIETEEFVEQLLKGRISVYQFLRNPNQQTSQKVVDNFQQLSKNVTDLKTKSISKEDITQVDTIVSLSKDYIDHLNKFSSKLIEDFSNGKTESAEVKENIKQMVQVGTVLEEKIIEISNHATKEKDEASASLNTILIILSIISII